jgi:hypothetical protein
MLQGMKNKPKYSLFVFKTQRIIRAGKRGKKNKDSYITFCTEMPFLTTTFVRLFSQKVPL